MFHYFLPSFPYFYILDTLTFLLLLSIFFFFKKKSKASLEMLWFMSFLPGIPAVSRVVGVVVGV